MSIPLYLALNNLQAYVFAAPVDSTTEHFISWQPQPNARGTWSILCSCIITLILVVYTVIHPNVSHTSQTSSQTWWKLPGSVCLGFFLPECMLCVALAQWIEARKLSADLRVLREQLQTQDRSLESADEVEEVDNAVLGVLQSWTLKHSYFVAMGGLQFPPDAAVQDKDTNLPRTILTPAGFISLLKNGYGQRIPIISSKDIDERSKSDSLAKLLCSIQGSWFVLQLLERRIDHLTITLLEMYTFINFVIVLATYGFWMFKPRKIRQPMTIDPQGLDLWLLIASGLNQREWRWLLNCGLGLTQSQERCDVFPAHQSVVEPEAGKCYYCSNIPDHYKESGHHETKKQGLYLNSDVETPVSDVVSEMNSNFESCSHVIYVMREEIGNQGLTCPCTEEDYGGHDSAEEREAAVNSKTLELIHVNKERLEILLQVWRSATRDQLLHSFLQSKQITINPNGESDPWFLQQMSSMFKQEYCNSFGNVLTFLLILSAYGAVNTSLWYLHFPSTRDRNEWLNSSTAIAALPGVIGVVGISGIAIFVCCVLGRVGRRTPTNHRSSVRGLERLVKVFSIALGSLVVTSVVQFTMKRFWLIFEAFWSLSSQPDDAYKTPSWTQWIPHL